MINGVANTSGVRADGFTFKCLAMNGTHNYHRNIKMYVLRCTTIGLKQECGHKTSRRADMNLRFKSHFTAKIGQFFVPSSQKMRLCVDCPGNLKRYSFCLLVVVSQSLWWRVGWELPGYFRFIFIRPSLDGTYYGGMALSVRPVVST